jgi:dipeptidyl aminopeptidase/acylaminoacyl peptidase
MNRENRLLIVILIVLTVGVLATGALVAYVAISRGREAANPAEPAGSLTLLLTPTTPVSESRIAYATDQSEQDELTAIYSIASDGSDPRRVAGSENGACIWPVWSPDGQRIAYLTQSPREGRALGSDDVLEVWVAAADGSGSLRVSDAITEVLVANWTIVTWSPDGTRLAFVTGPEDGRGTTVYVVRADGSGAERRISLDWTVHRVLWSPAGDELLFLPYTSSDEKGVYVLHLDEQRVEQVYPNVRTVDWYAQTADWSPDGTEFVVGVDLSQQVVIVGRDGEARWAAQLHAFPIDVAWSPDGARIAVATAPSPQQNAHALHVISLDAGTLATIADYEDTSIFRPNWSPDGKRLLFSTIYDRQEGVPNPIDWPASTLWAYNVTSGEMAQLTPGVMHDGMGAWSP